jgi:YidC/Oxa1 family membrane protein insertase
MLSHAFSSYGVVILLLTFIIRLLMSPFTYKSYVSSAKMKALKPELDELREKMGDDKQAFGMEQMKLYRQAGVNPLGGCLPALLQLPVFFALLSFFPHAIELRQEKFLWANDLSTYDSILNLPFTIPFYGDHISLFTILFVITSLLMALYSMNMTADQNNPMMKYLPFIMPVMFLGIFNKLPAALTFYYFVSNVITLGLQFVIQQWIIDPEKIHAKIQAKKNEPPKENKLMKKMMEMQKQNEERMKKGGKK